MPMLEVGLIWPPKKDDNAMTVSSSEEAKGVNAPKADSTEEVKTAKRTKRKKDD